MAANSTTSLLLLLPSTPHNNRKGSDLGDRVLSISVGQRSFECSLKVYSVPRRVFDGAQVVRCFKSNGSAQSQGGCRGDDVSCSAFVSTDLGRSKLLDTSSNSMNDFERQLQEFFDEVKAMLKRSNVEGAIELLKANYEVAKEQMDAGNKGMEQAALLDVVALGYMGVGNIKMVTLLLEMLKEIVTTQEDNEPIMDSVLIHMGSMYTHIGKFGDAMLMYERSLKILEGLYGQSSPFLIIPLLGMAKVYTSITRASKAIDTYHRAITILEMSKGAGSEDIVVPLLGLGNLLLREGKAAEAENSFSRIFKIYEELYGENDGRTGLAMCSLAHTKSVHGDLDEAILLYNKGLQVIKDSKYMSLDDEVIEKIRIDLAELLHAAGRQQEGRKLLEECLLIAEKYDGKSHPSLVTHLINLATSYSRSKNFVEAERLLRSGLRIMQKAVEPDDQSITIPMLHLAVTLYHLNRDTEAEHLALEVVRIREEAFGRESLLVGEALDCLVSIQTRLNKDDGETLALLKRVLSIQQRELGEESEEVMLTMKKVLFYLNKMGRRDEKLLLERKLSLLRRKYKLKVKW
ncbi:hypothetical protein Sjap_005558 [Stephania japonica]|uniref:Nephrocystin-3 n=1 Tax=Stephania japonica TaxID=461633 RepID=A0AAP0K5D9_9MAGN